MTLPMVVRSGVMPKWAWAQPLAIRKPVMTSSKQSRGALLCGNVAQALQQSSCGLTELAGSIYKHLEEEGEGPPP